MLNYSCKYSLCLVRGSCTQLNNGQALGVGREPLQSSDQATAVHRGSACCLYRIRQDVQLLFIFHSGATREPPIVFAFPVFIFRRDERAAYCFRFPPFFQARRRSRLLFSLFPFFLGATKEPPIVFAFPVFLFGRHTALYGSSQDLCRILITMHQKMRLKSLRAMA